MKKETREAGWEFNQTGVVRIAPSIKVLYDKHTDGTKRTFDFVKINKAEAEICFGNMIANRNIDKASVETVRKELNEGKWDSNATDDLTFTPEGRGSNGQHRYLGLIASNVDDMIVGVKINVPLETTILLTDSGKKRTPKDRLAMRLGNRKTPRKPFDIESQVVTAVHVYSPINSKMQYGRSVSSSQICSLYEEGCFFDEVIFKTLKIYDNLNVGISKKSAVFWANMLRAYKYFEEENRIDDLENFALLTFNSLASPSPENQHEGWAKLTKDLLDNMRDNPAQGNGTVKASYCATISFYLNNFYRKIPCPKSAINSRRLTENKTEYFLMPNERAIAEVNQQKEKIKKVDLTITKNKKHTKVNV